MLGPMREELVDVGKGTQARDFDLLDPGILEHLSVGLPQIQASVPGTLRRMQQAIRLRKRFMYSPHYLWSHFVMVWPNRWPDPCE